MKFFYKKAFSISVVVLLFFSVFALYSRHYPDVRADNLELDEQTATINAIKANKDAVVSIVVYKEVPTNIGGLYTITNQELGAGTGFLISSNGLILTNKHVVKVDNPKTVQYRVILNSGKKYYAKLIAVDSLYDIAVLKIYDKDLPYVKIGDSDKMEVGATVIAIGNVLGRYQNSVTKGIVSGLGRDFVATDKRGGKEFLTNTIQTDAEINFGNSGGPLINLEGEVIGVNVAIDQSGSNIGFAIPINDVKSIIGSVKKTGLIVRPKLGVYYVMLTPESAKKNNLPRSSGAYVFSDEGEAVLKGSPADKAGILPGDIIFEINAIKINDKNDLRSVIQNYKPGDKIGMKIQRGNKVIIRTVTLGKF